MDFLRLGRGSVVVVSSIAGLIGEEGLALYTSTKAALIGLVRSLALELGRDVRFNAVCPGQIETRMMTAALSDPTRRLAIEQRIPVGRIGQPADVAAAVAWLLTADASFVNGAILPVDGGESAGIRASAPYPSSSHLPEENPHAP